MNKAIVFHALVLAVLQVIATSTYAGQAPLSANAPDITISSQDRVYLSDQTSNTVSVVNPFTEKLLGVIRLGDPTPGNLSPLYKGQLLVHGMGFSSKDHTLAVVSIGSNSVSFIDTQTNLVKHTAYVGRSPHEAMFTPDGKEVWVTIRGEDYIQVLDGHTYAPSRRISVPNGPGMTIFSPDKPYAYVCSSFSPETVVIDTRSHQIVGRIKQASPFCPDIAATPDGMQVWLTLKDIGKTQVFNAAPPFNTLAVLDTGPLTNHVNIVNNNQGQFAYVTVGGLNAVKVFTADDQPRQITTIATGALPHGLWPSGDGQRIYIGLENANAVAVIETLSNKVVSTIDSGQSPQGIVYIPQAVPEGSGLANLAAIDSANDALHLTLGSPKDSQVLSTVTLNSQGLVDLLQAAVTGLMPKTPYLLAMANHADGTGTLEPLAKFMSNPAGAAVVTAIGPLRKASQGNVDNPRRYLVVLSVVDGKPDAIQQVQQ
ncbi:MAG: YncE family protein [Methylotenera sp.]|nr:YncE family protein [Methylotenera sp.]MDD4925301.1 YncE family protein [Methylotenera sp.]